MMTLRGDLVGLQRLVGQPLLLCLYTNEASITKRAGASAFTQPTVAGYKPIKLDGDWQFHETQTHVTASYAEQTFVFREKGPDLQGYFVAELDGSPLWADRFEDENGQPEPIPMRRPVARAHISPFVRSL